MITILSEVPNVRTNQGIQNVSDLAVDIQSSELINGYEGEIKIATYWNKDAIKNGLQIPGVINQISTSNTEYKQRLIKLVADSLMSDGLDIREDWILDSEWVYQEKPMRVFIYNEYAVKAGWEIPEKIQDMKSKGCLSDFHIAGLFIYFDSLQPGDEVLIETYKGIPQEKPEE